MRKSKFKPGRKSIELVSIIWDNCTSAKDQIDNIFYCAICDLSDSDDDFTDKAWVIICNIGISFCHKFETPQNVVYLISCNNQYVGGTKGPLYKRMNSQRDDWRHSRFGRIVYLVCCFVIVIFTEYCPET